MYATLPEDGSILIFEDDGTTRERIVFPYQALIDATATGATIDLTHGNRNLTLALRFYRRRVVMEPVYGGSTPLLPVMAPVVAPADPPAFLPPATTRIREPAPWRGQKFKHDERTLHFWRDGFLNDIREGKPKPLGGTRDYWRLQVIHRKDPPSAAQIAEASRGEWAIHSVPKRKRK